MQLFALDCDTYHRQVDSMLPHRYQVARFSPSILKLEVPALNFYGAMHKGLVTR